MSRLIVQGTIQQVQIMSRQSPIVQKQRTSIIPPMLKNIWMIIECFCLDLSLTVSAMKQKQTLILESDPTPKIKRPKPVKQMFWLRTVIIIPIRQMAVKIRILIFLPKLSLTKEEKIQPKRQPKYSKELTVSIKNQFSQWQSTYGS